MERPSDDPIPRRQPVSIEVAEWVVARSIACPAVIPPTKTAFVEVVEDRRTVRSIRPAPFREVVNAIGYATRPRFLRENDEHHRSLRPSISAGALHPIEMMLVQSIGSPRVFRYSPHAHRLDCLPIQNPAAIEALRSVSKALLPSCNGSLLVLIGRPGLVRAHYENHISLYWRDAGALLQTLAFVCTAFRLAFCPLGILGGQMTEALNLDPAIDVAVGTALIGRAAGGQ